MISYIWSIVGATISLFGIIFALYFYILQRKKTELSYELLGVYQLLNVSRRLHDSVEIFYKKEMVQDIDLVIIKIINSGNTPITSVDYESPIEIEFLENSRLLSEEVVDKSPKESPVKYGKSNNTIFIDPILLNDGDFFDINILIENYNGFSIKSRIAGVKDILPYSISIKFDSIIIITCVITLIITFATAPTIKKITETKIISFADFGVLQYSMLVATIILLSIVIVRIILNPKIALRIIQKLVPLSLWRVL